MSNKTVLAIAVLGVACMTAATAQAKSDKDFLTDAIKGDNSEIMLGNLAADKGGSKDVRSFGDTLATDHGKAKQQAAAVARRMNVPVTDQMTDEARQGQKKLQGMSGAEFDKEFANYMVSDHKKDISEFEDEAKSGKGSVAKLAKMTLPTLRKHLHIAQSLQKG
ncbi:DUF4142 domain-containing protein [Mesorhizobium sp. WSM4976]|uniref:DUF4142 domain-containing protein n=1 Tax=Mesorhizobium sp. WSM4976 TaxID=3038549 RepID=UPI002415D388|nr:DUF4142 domain-containing protein [Mesorhizobium sp. WSM4976]MDG4897712.1 DUF4142 domain-containing protein [Mesorhizobium sp. WSM4976]